MSPERRRPRRPRQINKDGGVGFQDGDHHHHYADYVEGTARRASRRATGSEVTVGPPIAEWEPADLGVHASITVRQETSLTPYLTREHDRQLRAHLRQAQVRASPALLLVVGTSCTGKTRALYEAVGDVLPDWQLVFPLNDTGLVRLLTDGVPARTVVWLDELQDRLTTTASGITAAKAITELLAADNCGPIVFAGTMWRDNFQDLMQRPPPAQAALGAGAIRTVLTNADAILMPETFSIGDLAEAPDDPRLTVAIATAAQTNDGSGRKLIQVLAGGPQLVRRVNCNPAVPGAFSPGARAIIHAAGDLRRVGLTGPIPRWVLEGVAAGYVDVPQASRNPSWFQAALEQLTEASGRDDHLTGTQTLDIHSEGVPALVPMVLLDNGGNSHDAYQLHDYLEHDHLKRHRRTATREALWHTLIRADLSLEQAIEFAFAAEQRGLITYGIELVRPHPDASVSLAVLLATRATSADLTELRLRAAEGDWAAQDQVAYLGEEAANDRAGTDGDGVLAEDAGDDTHEFLLETSGEIRAVSLESSSMNALRAASQAGNKVAMDRLARRLAERRTRGALLELTDLVMSGRGGRMLIEAHRRLGRRIVELDLHANPVVDPQGDDRERTIVVLR